MKYMLLIYGNDDTWNALHDEGIEQVLDRHRQLTEELKAKGEYLDGLGLTTANARVVRVNDGVAAVTDGPFTESKEWIAGFDVIECADWNEAIEVASKHPMARFGRIELRRAWPLGSAEE